MSVASAEAVRPDTAGGAGVVVGVDGSPSSISALQRGAQLAAALGVPIRAVIAWDLPFVYGPYVGDSFTLDSRGSAEAAQAVLDQSVEAAFGDDQPEGFRGSVREGRAAQALIAASRGADMLVVGSRSRGSFLGLIMGSVSTECAEQATCPVLVFHSEPPVASPERPATPVDSR